MKPNAFAYCRSHYLHNVHQSKRQKLFRRTSQPFTRYTTMNKLSVGFVGAGFMGQLAHLENYTRLDDCEIVALAEPRPKLAREVARRYGIADVYRSHSELLESTDLDAVIAVLPYARHYDVVPDILRAGVPVFTEKPLTVTANAGRELVEISEDRGVLHAVGYHKRSDPAMEHAKEMVDRWKETGEQGSMRYIRITMPPGDWVGGATDPITTDEEAPEGEKEAVPASICDRDAELYDHLVNYYIHQINALRFLLGGPYSIEYVDPAQALLVAKSDRGVTGVIEMAPYHTSVDWQERVLIGFETGYVTVDLPPPLARQRAGVVEVMRSDEEQSTMRPEMPPESAMKRQAKNFLAAVRGERPPPCDSREAVEDLEIAHEYVESIASGRR